MREIILDIETTGLDYKEGHKIIEIGCFELINKEVKNYFHQYINPSKKMTEENISIHGLTNEFLEPFPPFEDIAENFLGFIKDDCVIAHNASFDIGFLNNELLSARLKKITQDKVIDTLVIAREMFPGQQINLDSLVKKLKINTNIDREHHGALKDAKILTDVYLELRGHTQIGLDLSANDSHIMDKALEPFNGTIEISKEESDKHNELMINIKNMNKLK